MDKVVGAFWLIVFWAIVSPTEVHAAFRISSSTIEGCVVGLPVATGQSEILFGSPNEYRSNTISVFSVQIIGYWITKNLQTSGWALTSITEYPFGLITGPDVRIATTHLYQRQTCNFWEDWAEKSTLQVNCGIDHASPP